MFLHVFLHPSFTQKFKKILNGPPPSLPNTHLSPQLTTPTSPQVLLSNLLQTKWKTTFLLLKVKDDIF